MEKVTVRPYNRGDETGILELYSAVFEINVSYENWQWQYQLPPELPAIVVVAESSQGIIGHYAIQPRPFWVNGMPCLAGLTVGTMVHPAARNLKTLVEMAHLSYELCRQKGLLFLYTFPRDAAWKVSQAVLGWQALPQLTEWEGLLEWSQFSSLDDTKVYNDVPSKFLDNFSLPSDEGNYTGINARRTSAWLQWRFFQTQKSKYKLVISGDLNKIDGYAVIKEYNRESILYGHIVDWQVPVYDNATAKNLLAAVWNEFARIQVERVSCWALPKSSLSHLLPEFGLTLTGQKTNFGYFNLALENDRILANYDNWNIYMGDSDVY